jgi:hypothetical protein
MDLHQTKAAAAPRPRTSSRPPKSRAVLAIVSSRRRGLLLCASHGTGLPGLASGSLDRSVRMATPAALTPVRGG